MNSSKNHAYNFLATDASRLIAELIRDGLEVTAHACLCDYEEQCGSFDGAAELTEDDFVDAIRSLVDAKHNLLTSDSDDDTPQDAAVRAAFAAMNDDAE